MDISRIRKLRYILFVTDDECRKVSGIIRAIPEIADCYIRDET